MTGGNHSVTMIRSPFVFSYHLHGSVISRYNKFALGLGFKLSCNLNPGLHIDMVCCKALKVFGIIMWLVNDFKANFSIKVSFCS